MIIYLRLFSLLFSLFFVVHCAGINSILDLLATKVVVNLPCQNKNKDKCNFDLNKQAKEKLIITKQPENALVQENSTVIFSIEATGVENIIYQWQMAPLGSLNFTDIVGANNKTYETSRYFSSNPKVQYRCIVSNNGFERISNIVRTTTGIVITIMTNLNRPSGLVVDNIGNLYIADTGNNRILKRAIDGTITTVTTNINNPKGLATDKNNNVYVAEYGGHLVLKINPSGNISTIAGLGPINEFGQGGFGGDGGLAISAYLNTPNGVAVDNNNNIYIADRGNNRIRKVDVFTGIINTISGNGGNSGAVNYGSLAINTRIFSPTHIAFDSIGNLYVTSSGESNGVDKIDTNGILTTIAGSSSIWWRRGPTGRSGCCNINRPLVSGWYKHR